MMRQNMDGFLAGIAPETHDTDRNRHGYLFSAMNKYTMEFGTLSDGGRVPLLW